MDASPPKGASTNEWTKDKCTGVAILNAQGVVTEFNEFPILAYLNSNFIFIQVELATKEH
jgi:hypothetical protein